LKPSSVLKQVTASVITNDEIMPGIYLIWLESTDIEPAAQPGQFVMVRCGDYILPRPISIHRLADKGGKLALLFNVIGKGTHWLSQRKTGDNIDLLGLLGNGYSIQPDSRHLLLVAGGIGIAPLYFAAQEAVKKGCSVKLLYGTPNRYRYPEDLLPFQIELVSATEDGSVGRKGMVTDLLPDFADWADQVFACGPLSMYRDMTRRKQELQLEGKPVQISLEVRMGCGLGVCYGCTVKAKNGLKQVCKDGPVFDLDDILWDELADI
jgi:dihydroorotate dehydrogenase electron transfer subunit